MRSSTSAKGSARNAGGSWADKGRSKWGSTQSEGGRPRSNRGGDDQAYYSWSGNGSGEGRSSSDPVDFVAACGDARSGQTGKLWSPGKKTELTLKENVDCRNGPEAQQVGRTGPIR